MDLIQATMPTAEDNRRARVSALPSVENELILPHENCQNIIIWNNNYSFPTLVERADKMFCLNR